MRLFVNQKWDLDSLISLRTDLPNLRQALEDNAELLQKASVRRLLQQNHSGSQPPLSAARFKEVWQ